MLLDRSLAHRLRGPAALVVTGALLCGCSSVGAQISGGPPASAPVVASAAPMQTPAPSVSDPAWVAPLPMLTVSPLLQPRTPSAPRRSAAPPAPATKAATNKKVVYLTFDDGPGPYTHDVLKVLKAYNAHATFFVIGQQAAHARGTLRAEYAAGHGIGNHTWNHRSLAHTTWPTFSFEVGKTQRTIRDATGHAPQCLRPPGGATDKYTAARAKTMGVRLRKWSLDTDDWKKPGTRNIEKRVLYNVKSGSVVLMHDGGGNRAQTVRALRVILKTLGRQGYTFEALCR